MSRLQVAIIEDDNDIATIIAAMVDAAGHEASTYSSARAFLQDIDKRVFDMILCDISMPEMDGIELREYMLAEGKQNKAGFIFITARQNTDYRTRAWDLKADGYLHKPFEGSEFMALFKNIAARRAEHLSDIYHDSLTGLLNRRYFTEQLAATFHGRVVQMVLLDLDNFKIFNDEHGHPAGDQCLIQVANLMRQSFPADAALIRLGGEEFLVAADVETTTIQERCARLQSLMAEASLADEKNSKSQITISGGILTNIPKLEENLENAYKKADQLLYEAKRAGRNRFGISSW